MPNTSKQADGVVAEVLKLMPQLMRGVEGRTPSHAQHHGASPAQMKTIIHLSEYGPQTMGELARGLGITTPSATGLVGPLVEKGLVKRQRDPMDRRVVRVSLTDKAEKIGSAVLRELHDEIAEALDGMSPEAQENFLQGFRRLTEVYSSSSRQAQIAS